MPRLHSCGTSGALAHTARSGRTGALSPAGAARPVRRSQVDRTPCPVREFGRDEIERESRYFLPPRGRRCSTVRGRFKGFFAGFHPTELLARERRPGSGASWERGRPARTGAKPPRPRGCSSGAGRPARTGAKRPEENAGGTPAFPGPRSQERSREACPAKTPQRTCFGLTAFLSSWKTSLHGARSLTASVGRSARPSGNGHDLPPLNPPASRGTPAK